MLTPGGRSARPVPADVRAQVRTEVGPGVLSRRARPATRSTRGSWPGDREAFHGRGRTVAGYDLTFLPVKSCRRCGRSPTRPSRRRSRGPSRRGRGRARFIEERALFTRVGAQGCGRSTSVVWSRPRSCTATPGPGIRICTPMSRSRTRSRPSTGAGWRSTGGCCSRRTWRRRRPTTPPSKPPPDRLGVGSLNGPAPTAEEADPRDRRRRPRLTQRWSARRPSIEVRRGELAAIPGRPRPAPTPVEAIRWHSRPPWRPATPSTNPASWPSNAQRGGPRPYRSSAARPPCRDAPHHSPHRPWAWRVTPAGYAGRPGGC